MGFQLNVFRTFDIITLDVLVYGPPSIIYKTEKPNPFLSSATKPSFHRSCRRPPASSHRRESGLAASQPKYHYKKALNALSLSRVRVKPVKEEEVEGTTTTRF